MLWAGPVSGGDLSLGQVQSLRRAIASAENVSGLHFSVYLGIAEEDSRSYAVRLHSALDFPDNSVLLVCDPEFHKIEIVTGRVARRQLDDVECRLAAAAMQTSVQAGDVVGGLVHGLSQLGESGRAPRTLHSHRQE